VSRRREAILINSENCKGSDPKVKKSLKIATKGEKEMIAEKRRDPYKFREV
jgi:hypothetical protein